MYKRYIAAVLLYLIATTRCEVQDIESQNQTSVESTTDAIKVIAKRQSVEAPRGVTNEGTRDNALGLVSVGLQLIGGLVQNMLDTNGINAQAVGSVINLFNPDKIRGDLLLIRRAFNLLARFGVVLNKYLPSPSPSSYSFSPLDLLSSKVRVYTPKTRDNVQWVAINKQKKSKSLLKVPARVQMVVDYVTQTPLVTSTTQKLEPSRELETNQNLNNEIPKVTENRKENIPDDSRSVIEKETNISTTASQNYLSQGNSSSNFTINKEDMKETLQVEYGLPTVENKSENISKVNDLLLTENIKVKPTSVVEEYGTPSKDGGNFISNKSSYESSTTTSIPSVSIPTGEDKSVNVSIKEAPQVYDLLLPSNNNKDKNNEIAEEYGLPSPSESGGMFTSNRAVYESSTASNEIQKFEEYSLPAPYNSILTFRPIPQQEYGVPSQRFTNNNLGRRRDKTGLPSKYVSEVFARLPPFERGFLNRNEIQKNRFVNIADVPLERNTIFDRRHGPLIDSFGFPVRN